MKRSFYGLAMLLALLALGILSAGYMQRCHDQTQQSLQLASACAEAGQWEQAGNYLKKARSQWEEKWGITAALSDHEPMETVNDLLSQLEVFARERDRTHFCAVCAQLLEALNAISGAHRTAWWNLA